MKIDKRLTEEFGVQLPSPSRPAPVEWLLSHSVWFTIGTALLALGALIGNYYPPAFWWFFGASAFAILCMLSIFGLVLFANSIDEQHYD